MLSRNNSYFDPELCIDGHYIVTGATNDQFCSDVLELTDVLPALHNYLRYEQGFEAVFFFDPESMLFCLDNQSFDYLTGSNLQRGDFAGADVPTGVSGEVSAGGPLGGARRRRRSSQQDSARQPVNRPDGDRSSSLSLGRMSLDAAWQQVSAVMKRSERRCALVIDNANLMQGGEGTLNKLSSFYNANHSVVVYIFRETTMSNVREWTNFARNVLLSRMESTDPQANRVISLGTPNCREVRNLLNHLRLDSSSNVRVRPGDIVALGEILAACCARKGNWGLARLHSRIDRYSSENPGLELSLDTWQDFMEERDYLSPMNQLERMVGQQRVKDALRGWVALQRGKLGDRPEPVSSSRFAPLPSSRQQMGQALNVRLKGSSGTGKTTIARIIGQFYFELGLLPQGHTVERSAAELVSGFVGHTAELVRQSVQEALGGVLFIDEAYALMDNQHGEEAVNQLVNDMSAYEGQFAVVIAGYPRQIDELMRVNDGLASRFPNEYVLEDYSPEEMQEIFCRMATMDGEGPITFSPGLEERMGDFFHAWVGGRGRGWGNAREAATLLGKMKRRCSLREADQGLSSQGHCLAVEDVPEELQHCLAPRSRGVDDALSRIDGMIGLGGIKRFLRDLTQRIRLGEAGGAPGNFIFAGPPGTGKTTIAREMGDLLGLLGVLQRPTNNVRECRAADLLNGSIQLNDAVDEARKGIFFLDEAHQLAQSDRGRAIIRALVPLLEDPEIRADTCFICAGYTVEMRDFLEVDSGLARRFPEQNRIRFNDYTADELTQILEVMTRGRGNVPSEGYLERSRAALTKYMERRPANFGNGGFIRDTYLPGSIAARTRRLSLRLTGSEGAVPTAEQVERLTWEERTELTERDIPASFERLAGPVGRRHASCGDAMERVQGLVGKDEIVAFARDKACGDADQEFFDEDVQTGLHYAIVGPSGSGRHTAARTLAALWKQLGILERDDVVQVGKGDLEAGYVGQTAGKARRAIERAVGGTLVVDAPSSMLPKNSADNTFGTEALGEIGSAMGGHPDDLSVVLVDTEEGFDALTKSSPSLCGQLVRVFHLDDLTPEQMYLIFKGKTADSMAFDAELEALLPDFFLNWVSDRGGLGDALRSWSNGSEIDRLISDLRLNWRNADGGKVEERVEEGGSSYLISRRLITPGMFPEPLRRYLKQASVVSDQALSELEALPGLAGVKRSIRNVERRIRRLGRGAGKPGCYLYLGNPGVGKTTVARLMGGVLKAAGVLRQGHVIERTARQMGDSIDEFDGILRLARQGILFIDEAHQLAEPGNYWGREVIKRLLTVLEDDEVTDSTCIILAGYPRAMEALLRQDEGLASRFGSEDNRVLFDDYTVDELMQVMEYMASRADRISDIGATCPLRMDDDYLGQARSAFADVLSQGNNDFGNARFVRTFLRDSLSAQLERFDREFGEGEPPSDEVDLLTGEDLPLAYRNAASAARRAVELDPEELNSERGSLVTDGEYDAACGDLSRSVVLLESWRHGTKVSSGTGSIVTAEGHVLTCAHVVKGADKVRARVYCPGAPGGDFRWFESEVLEPICEDCDMAVLLMDGTNFTPAAIRPPSEPVKAGEQTVLLGYPLGDRLANGAQDRLNMSNFAGRVASVQQAGAVDRCFIDSTGLHGNSGSPVFSREDRRMIGVFSGSIIPNGEGSLDELNYFYPIRYFWEKFLARREDEMLGEEDHHA